MLTEFLLQRPMRSAPSSIGGVAQRTAALPSEEPQGTLLSTEAYRLDVSQSSWQASRRMLLGQKSADSTERTDEPPQGLYAESAQSDDSQDAGEAQGSSKDEASSLPGEEELSAEDQRKAAALAKIDQEVHTHEQAHLAAAGSYALGGAQYEYATGPDGDRYAVAGHVNMDTGRENSPDATLRKAMTVQKAALAPASPSASDRQIAAAMAQMAQEARSEIAQENMAPARSATADSADNAPTENQNGASRVAPTSTLRRGAFATGIEAYHASLQMAASGAVISLVA